jgi:hypothetical protein
MRPRAHGAWAACARSSAAKDDNAFPISRGVSSSRRSRASWYACCAAQQAGLARFKDLFSHREWSKKRYAENAEYREKRRAARKRYYESHKQTLRERRILKRQNDPEHRERELARDREWKRKKRFENVYGISLADYDVMLARQRGLCAICKQSGQTLCVDHCHATGKVRGLLCSKCNSALGFCDDDPKRLWAAIAYLLASRDDERPVEWPIASNFIAGRANQLRYRWYRRFLHPTARCRSIDTHRLLRRSLCQWCDAIAIILGWLRRECCVPGGRSASIVAGDTKPYD